MCCSDTSDAPCTQTKYSAQRSWNCAIGLLETVIMWNGRNVQRCHPSGEYAELIHLDEFNSRT